MSSIVGIIGSLRSGSVNAIVARAAAARHDAVTLHDISDLPLYHGDEEEAGPPAAATALHDVVAAADGVVFFTPEYNSSYPAVTKNAIDWLSRPPGSWEGKAMTMVVASPGGRAGAGVREHFESTIGFRPVRVFPTLGLGSYGERLTPEGELNDETTAELMAFLDRFAEFAAGD
ncbi:MAG: NADPH-dependent FMN reductase [Actinomycetota bacterium]